MKTVEIFQNFRETKLKSTKKTFKMFNHLLDINTLEKIEKSSFKQNNQKKKVSFIFSMIDTLTPLFVNIVELLFNFIQFFNHLINDDMLYITIGFFFLKFLFS